MGIPQSHGRAARPSIVRLTDTDVGGVAADAVDGALVTLAEGKRFLNLDHDEDDSLVTALIHAGEAEAEGFLNRDLRARNYQAVFGVDGTSPQFFSTGRPAASVSGVYGWNSAGVLTTLDSEGEDREYAVRAGRGGEKVVVLDSDALSLYAAGNDDGDLLLIDFTTADASSAALVGYHAIKRAVLHKVAGGYEARESQVQGAPISDNPAVERLLRPYRYVMGLASGGA